MKDLIRRFLELYDDKKYTESLMVGKWLLKMIGESNQILRAKVAYNQGCALLRLGMYDEGVEYFSITTNILFNEDRESPLYVKALQNLALAHHYNEGFEKAVYLQNMAIQLIEHTAGRASDMALDARYNLANFYLDEGEIEEAAAGHLSLVAARASKTLGRIDSLISLAHGCEINNSWEEAFNYAKKALFQIRRRLGEDNEEFVGAMFYAAQLLYEGDNLEASIRYGNRALKIIENFDDMYMAKIEISDFLSLLSHENNQIDKAIRHKKDAIDYFRHYSDANHLVLANDYNSLAQLYMEKGQFERVSFCLEEALEMKARLLGKRHINYVKDALTACLFWLDHEEFTKAYTYVFDMFSTFSDSDNGEDIIEAKSLLAVLDLFENMEDDTWYAHKDMVSDLMDQLEDVRALFEDES